MPAISIKTSAPLGAAAKMAIKQSLGQIITIVPRKSERWLMVLFENVDDIYLGGDKDEPAAFIEVGLFGSASKETYDALTREMMAVLTEKLNISGERIYIKYSETPFWGWNGKNF
ncbi:MAG TPA: phenylpyruvate tautomerase MIF-related protein [Clostridia bacterium]|nr:phenylpyruvate tautomerase MIF-related protein [Clostridia bacterium]